MNKLTELTDIEFEDYAHKTHPISDQRTSSHGALVATYFLEQVDTFQFNVNTVVDFGAEVITEVAMPAYSKMFKKEILDDRLLFFYSKQGMPYINNVRRGWNEVREDLKNHSYLMLAPEDEMFKEDGLYDYEEILKKKRDRNVDSGGEV